MWLFFWLKYVSKESMSLGICFSSWIFVPEISSLSFYVGSQCSLAPTHKLILVTGWSERGWWTWVSHLLFFLGEYKFNKSEYKYLV